MAPNKPAAHAVNNPNTHTMSKNINLPLAPQEAEYLVGAVGLKVFNCRELLQDKDNMLGEDGLNHLQAKLRILTNIRGNLEKQINAS